MELELLPTPSSATPLDPTLASDLAALQNATRTHVPVPPLTPRGLNLAMVHGEEPTTGLWVARDEGRIVGYVQLVEPERQYTSVAFLLGAVHPDHQGAGIGRSLIDAAAAATDRPRLRARAWQGTAGEAALPKLGFTPRRTHVISELPLGGADWARMAQAPNGYAFTRWRGPTPKARLAEMEGMRAAITDSPDAGEFDRYPMERIAAFERSLAARGQTQFTVLAHHVASGEPAGVTMVVVDEEQPAIARQEDTSVLPRHRGHRLGVRLKADMAAWLRGQRPDVRATQTWNDLDNSYLLAVNEQLGARPVARNTVWIREN